MKLVKLEIPDSAKSYKPSEPFTAKVVGNQKLIEAGSSVDIRNIILDLTDSSIQYLEGQSIGIIPPGTQENGKPHRIRLYSIASSSQGDFECGQTVTLCVKRVVFQDENGQEVRGLASNYLCDLIPGDTVNIIGPTGRTFFLPQDDETNLIMVAAGTGIAPFRAFIHKVFRDHGAWKGQVRLFFGTRNPMESAYMNRANTDIGQYMEEKTFKAFQAFSHTQDSPKQYVQNQLEANQEEIWSMINEGNFSFYLCGMKAMEQGVNDVFVRLAERDGKNWDEMKAVFKQEGRWNIEVY